MKACCRILCWLSVAVLFAVNVHQCRRATGLRLPAGTYSDTLIVFDSVRVLVPVARDSVVIRYITERLPVELKTEDSVPKEPVPVPQQPESVPTDSVSVTIAITQKRYETDEYRAYVSGYRPSLDSLFFNQPTKIITRQAPPKRWSVGLQVGYGLQLGNTPQPSPYIGIGVSYSFLIF